MRAKWEYRTEYLRTAPQIGFPARRMIHVQQREHIRCIDKQSLEVAMNTTHRTVVRSEATFRSARSRVLALALSSALAGAAHAQSGDRIVIDGSTGGTPLVAALAKAYGERHPAVTVEIGKGMGTKARIKALAGGSIDIAMASHGLVVDDIVRQGMAVQESGKVAGGFGGNGTGPATGLAA